MATVTGKRSRHRYADGAASPLRLGRRGCARANFQTPGIIEAHTAHLGQATAAPRGLGRENGFAVGTAGLPFRQVGAVNDREVPRRGEHFTFPRGRGPA